MSTNTFWRKLRDDQGLMMQSQLLILVIPVMVLAILTVIFAGMQTDHIRESARKSDAAADRLSVLVLQNMNSDYPVEFLTASEDDLKKSTLHRDPATGAAAYVTAFSSCADPYLGWTCVNIKAYPNFQPGLAKSYLYRYQPSQDTAYHGVNTAGRPVWAASSGNLLDPLGVWQLVPGESDAASAEAESCDPCVIPNQVRNPRIIRSVDNGTLLAWNAPVNAGPAGVTHYVVTSTSGAPQCTDLRNDRNIIYSGVDGVVRLNDDFRAPDSEWLCNPDPGISEVTIRAVSPVGLGTPVNVILSNLPTSSDLKPANPSSVPKNLKVTNPTATGGTFSWDAVTCPADPDPNAKPQYRFVWVSGASGSSPWQTTLTYTTNGGNSSVLHWRVDVKCAGEYNDSDTLSSETASFIPNPSAPITLTRVSETTTSSTVKWSGFVCPGGSTAEFRVHYKLISANTWSTSGWQTSAQWTLSGSTSGQVYDWKVEIRCKSGSTYSGTATSQETYLTTQAAAPRSLTWSKSNPTASMGVPMTWEKITCTAGATPHYWFEWSNPGYGTPAWTTDLSVVATHDKNTETSVPRVKADCRYESVDSADSAWNTGGAIKFAPLPPTGLKLTGGTVPTGASWDAVYCPTGSSAQYLFVWKTAQSNGTAPVWQAGTSYAISSQLDGRPYDWAVKAKCVRTGFESAISDESAPGPKIIFPVNDPTSVPTGLSLAPTWTNPATANWNAVTCSGGATPQYRFVWVTPQVNGAEPTWSPSVSYVIPKQEEGSTYYWKVEARCAVGSSVSAGTVISAAGPLFNYTITPPTAPNGLAVSPSTTSPTTASWNAVTCAAGQTAQYRFVWTSAQHQGEVPAWGTARTYVIPKQNDGTSYQWKVQARCNLKGIWNSSAVDSAAGPTFTYAMTAPTSVGTAVRAGNTDAISMNQVIVCGNGAIPRYRSVLTKHGNSTVNTPSAWGSSYFNIGIQGAYNQGYAVSVKMQMMCQSSSTGAQSSVVDSNTVNWVTNLAKPVGAHICMSGGDTYAQCGSYPVNNPRWGGTCPAGSTISYRWVVSSSQVADAAGGVQKFADSRNNTWNTTSSYYNAGAWGNGYVLVNSRCNTSWASSAETIARIGFGSFKGNGQQLGG